MSLKIFLAQSPDEIINCTEATKLFIVPLDLATQLFCIKNSLNYINLSKYFDNKFHELSIKKLSAYDAYFEYLSSVSLVGEDLVSFVRFTLCQIFFIEEIINTLDHKHGLVDIHTSGWEIQTKNLYSDENYTASEITKFLFKERVTELRKCVKNLSADIKAFHSIDTKKVDLLINSRGYNMHRLAHVAKRVNLKVGILPGDYNLPAIIKSFSMGIHVPRCKYDIANYKSNFKLDDVILPDGEVGRLLGKFLVRKKNNFYSIAESCITVQEVVSKGAPRRVYSWSMRGSDGHLLKFARANGIQAFCIPHGTVSKGYAKDDTVYKQLIANAVFSGECTHLAIQSKIANAALENIKFIGKPIITGNLIFAETYREEPRHLLYAVTLKGFYGMQFWGVEMYYEFIENLKSLENISNVLKLPVLVNLHPSAHSLIQSLQDLFPTLKFSINGVSFGLKNAIATISYSSTSIEDSLNSKVPVILFDRWGRYKHCDAIDIANSSAYGAVYYASEEQHLIDAIKLVTDPEYKADFYKYVYEGRANDNFYNLLN